MREEWLRVGGGGAKGGRVREEGLRWAGKEGLWVGGGRKRLGASYRGGREGGAR